MQLSGSVVYYLVALAFVIEGMCVLTLTYGANTNVYIEFSAHDAVK
jgi:hypothetical protein